MLGIVLLRKFIKGAFSANLQCLHNPRLRNFHFRRVILHRNIFTEQNVSVNCLAYIHCSQTSRAKLFPDLENRKIHGTMENNPRYRDVVKCPTIDALKSIALEDGRNSSTQQQPNVFQRFIATIVDNSEDKLSVEDSSFRDLVLTVVSSLPRATDHQLRELLTCLYFWPHLSNHNNSYQMLWKSLDKECSKRLKNWVPGYKLLIADCFFHLRLSRITVYNSLMIKDMVESKDILSIPQLVQLMFYVNLQRDTPQQLLMLLEDKLEHVIKGISVEELCIVCLGFFKTKNRITSKGTVKLILLRLISEVSKAESLAIGGCLKFLRKSLHGDLTELYISMLNQAVKHIEKFDVPALIHLALLSAEINFYMPSLLDSAMDRLVDEKSAVRAKDCMKLLHCLAQFYHQPKPEFDRFVQGVLVDEEHAEEIRSYPRILFYSLLSYAYLGRYPVALISQALQPEFVKRCVEVHGVIMMNPIAALSYCVEIECDDYHGPRADESVLKMLETEKGNIPRDRGRQSFQARLLSLTFQVLSDILGNSNDICIKHVLPHMFSPDIILRLNSKDQVPLSAVLKTSGNRVVRPPPHELWACVMVCGGYCFPYRSKRLNGMNSMKHRQLLKLGYKVIQVPYFKAESAEQLKGYVKENLDLLEKNHVLNCKQHIL